MVSEAGRPPHLTLHGTVRFKDDDKKGECRELKISAHFLSPHGKEEQIAALPELSPGVDRFRRILRLTKGVVMYQRRCP
jgi:hypothetical protein